MPLIRRGLRILVTLFVVCAGIQAVYRLLPDRSDVSLKLSPSSVRIRTDHIYSETLKSAIADRIGVEILAGRTPSAIASEITSAFPVVRRVVWQRMSGAQAEVVVEGARPEYRVNENIVVSDDGSCFASHQFSQVDSDALPHRSVKRALLELNDNGELLAVLQAVPDDIARDYEVAHRDFSDVLLQPRNRLWHYSVVADPADLKQNSKVRVAHAVYTALLESDERKKACGQRVTWQLDTRFRGRVYARKVPTDTWGKGT